MSATNRGGKREAQDLYQTPQWCIDLLAKKLTNGLPSIPSGLTIIDPGAADGRIGETVLRAMRERVVPMMTAEPSRLICIERDPRWEAAAGHARAAGHQYVHGDFLEWLAGWKPAGDPSVLFVTNPPFSQAEAFIQKTIAWMGERKLTDGLAVFLLRLNWLGSEKRAKWVTGHLPSSITVLAPRPSFVKTQRVGKDGKLKWSSNDACEYAWVGWSWPPRPDGLTRFSVAVRKKELKA
jgi:hypothetical protein